MDFRRDVAIETLRIVADLIRDAWPDLDQDTRKDVAGLIRQYGPDIADVGPEELHECLNPVTRLMERLWYLRERLPITVAQTLASARGISPTVGVSISADAHAALLTSLVAIEDFRAYENARELAAEISRLVDQHIDRLTDDQRHQWQELAARHADLTAAAHDESDLEQGHETDDPAQAYLRGVEALLGDIPSVGALLEGRKVWKPRAVRRMEVPKSTLPPEMVPMEEIGPEEAGPEMVAMEEAGPEAAGPREVVRYGNVYFPATVLLAQEMVPLIVHIAGQYQEEGTRVSEEASAMTLRIGELTLIVHAEDFTVRRGIGGRALAGLPSARIVSVAPDRDCEPVIFFLDPQSAGKKRIAVDVYQFERNIATLAFETDVVDEAAISELANVACEPVPVRSPGENAKPPDLELRVVLSADRRTLSYFLFEPAAAGNKFRAVGEKTVGSPTAGPRDFLQPTFDRLSTLARRSPQDRSADETQQALSELADIGTNLYETLFPQAFKDAYRDLRARLAGKSLLITSDEPWIPWEMVRPFEADEDGTVLYDDPPLCEMFQVSRWVAGRGAPDAVHLRNGVWVAPPDNLEAAKVEGGFFAELRRQRWGVNFFGPLATVGEVEQQFEGGHTELFHFVCHGNFNRDDPAESKLKLAGGFLRPSQIVREKQAGLRRAKPVVFLNAFHSGDTGLALTQIDGWAQRFLDAGASAFIGSLWEINDKLAARFAREFYSRLWGLGDRQPTSLAQAFHDARLVIKQLDPANPTWLAYVLYGDPRGRVVLGGDA